MVPAQTPEEMCLYGTADDKIPKMMDQSDGPDAVEDAANWAATTTSELPATASLD
ncbi:hypothetical protein AB0N24_26630 [Arthrobacter sp. NPDC093128]|uniref:hypothetical protein n=1 Tax=Arthrobacter sp. NPDC093128 TaxID=3154979 RepID=UPI00341A70B9